MIEKYFYIETETARHLIRQAREMRAEKRGFEKQVCLLGNYAVLKATRIKLRNVVTRDDDLVYYDELIGTLMHLKEQGVGVVPVLGYCCDPDSADGEGYILQERASGAELYDDSVVKELYIGGEKFSYLSCEEENPAAYLTARTETLARAPQQHFDRFIRDMIVLLEHDILVDFNGKSNFFYDPADGFRFIDLDSHTDYKYGLTDRKPDAREIAAYYGFLPCHFAVGTRLFADIALDSTAVLPSLGEHNRILAEKCRTALLRNGVTEARLNASLSQMKFYGN